MKEKIRILLVDDHVLVRQGLRSLLEAEPDMQVVGEASSGEEGAEMAANTHPDVVVMDIAMPGLDGIAATSRVKTVVPAARVLILTMHAEERYLLPVLEAGGSGYVLKSATHQDLVGAIRVVFRGDVFLYPEAASMLMKHCFDRVHSGQACDSYQLLSHQERQVLRLVAEGHTSSEIAERLRLSPKTVDSYRERIARKLGIRRRTELVRYALRLGLLSASDR